MRATTICLALLSSGLALAADHPEIRLWANGAPGSEGKTAKEVDEPPTKDHGYFKVTSVHNPSITVYLPPAAQATGAAMVIAPGGGHQFLNFDQEGTYVADYLNSIGVAAFVLKYRLAREPGSTYKVDDALADAQRTIRVIRTRAAEWHVNPVRVGIMGFSAGGHLASTVGTHFTPGNPLSSIDPLDRFSSRPDFMVLIYPVISMNETITHTGSLHNLLGQTPDPKMVTLYSNELQVTPQTPPTFLAQAKDDRVSVENSVRFYAALQKAGVPSAIHLFEKGGHGYGLGINGGEPATWPGLCAAWLKTR
jgi:acetyl esterase/lipase